MRGVRDLEFIGFSFIASGLFTDVSPDMPVPYKDPMPEISCFQRLLLSRRSGFLVGNKLANPRNS